MRFGSKGCFSMQYKYFLQKVLRLNFLPFRYFTLTLWCGIINLDFLRSVRANVQNCSTVGTPTTGQRTKTHRKKHEWRQNSPPGIEPGSLRNDTTALRGIHEGIGFLLCHILITIIWCWPNSDKLIIKHIGITIHHQLVSTRNKADVVL